MAKKNTLSRRALALKNGYKSGLEDDVAKQIASKGLEVEYETLKIDWIDHQERTYRPDFPLSNGIIIETKGRFMPADRRKHLRIKEQRPELDIRFVFTNSKATYSKKTTKNKRSYADWCNQHGFKYADKFIPEEWFHE